MHPDMRITTPSPRFSCVRLLWILALGPAACAQAIDPADDEAHGAASAEPRGREFPSVELGDAIESVPAMTADEVAALREGAAELSRPVLRADGELVEADRELDRTGSDGNAALHYAMIELRSQRDAAMLSELGLHAESQPLFGEELREPSKESPQGIFREPAHDERGVFAFAIVPAAVYEAMMASAREGAPVFASVILREVPDERARDAEDTRSRLSWSTLVEEGHEWIALDEPRPVPADKSEAADDAEYFTRRAELVELARDELKAATETFVVWRDPRNAELAVKTVVRETDPVFAGTADPSTKRDMVRAWGTARGGPVDLRGIRLVANPEHGTKRYATIGAQNTAVLNLRTDRDYRLCAELATDAAKVMVAPPFATQACISGVIDTVDPSMVFEVRNPRMGWLVQAIEGFAWLDQIAGHDSMHRAKILTGPVANLISAKTSDGVEEAYAPCAGLYGAKWVQLIPELPGTIAGIADLFFNIDVVMPGTFADDFNRTRAGFTHEYGHVALCSLMRHGTAIGDTDDTGGQLRFEWAWQDMILHTAGRRGVEDESSWISEGFADFFASQTAGALSYVEPDTLLAHLIDNRGTMLSCDATFDDCLETNQRFPDLFDPGLPEHDDALFDAAVAGFVGVLHDMVDGHPTSSPAMRPNNGAAWIAMRDGSGTPFARLPGAFDAPRQNDEVVHLHGSGLVQMFVDWSAGAGLLPTLRLESVLPAAVSAMQAQDVPDAQICNLIELHLDGADCLEPAPGLLSGLDPDDVDDVVGDLFAPVGVGCTFPDDVEQMRCRWEDLSLFGASYEVAFFDADTNAPLASSVEPYSVFATHDYDVPADVEAVRIEVRTRVQDGRIGPAGIATFGVPAQPPEFGCGNGIVEFPEQCDGPTTAGNPNACPPGCASVNYCFDCTIVHDCEC